MGDIFHDTAAHYNGYFYAKEKALEVEKKILTSSADDPTQILRLLPKIDTTLAKSYVSDTEEIIKMASISIQLHPYSRWANDNYRLVGLARLYDCDYLSAIQTFKYVNKKSSKANLRHKAVNNLIRTYIEMGDLIRAEEAIGYLEKEELDNQNSKDLFLLKAYFHQIKGDYPQMLSNLTLAAPRLTRQDRKGRVYFIIGQLNQKLGNNESAYDYYKKCLRTNPKYEIDFSARLNLAQVTEVKNEKAQILTRKKFSKLLKDAKNSEYKDKMYYEFGMFEKKLNRLNEAIELFIMSAHSGQNNRIKGSAFLNVGQLYFDSLKQFSVAKSYYDSALAVLPKDFENYENIFKRQEILADFVKYSDIIQRSDSLLMMAEWDSTKLRSHIDSTLAIKTKIAETKIKNRRSIAGNNQTNKINSLFQTESNGTQQWYFGNPVAVATGQTDFQQIWGNIELTDDWRRSSKPNALVDNNVATTQDENPMQPILKKPKVEEAPSQDQLAEKEYDKIYSQLPKTDLQKNVLKDQIAEAYLKLGDIYNFQLLEKENAITSYQVLLERFPNSILISEAIYKLYLINKEKGHPISESYKQRLLTEFPNSIFSKIILNPNYLEENRLAEEKQKQIYGKAYKYYEMDDMLAAQTEINLAKEIGETGFYSHLELLQILITGKTEDVTQYQAGLITFINRHPQDTLRYHAEYLLKSSKQFVKENSNVKGIRYLTSLEKPHIFVIAHKLYKNPKNTLINIIQDFNFNFYKKLNLQTTSLNFNDSLILTFSEFLPDKNVAIDYINKFSEQVATKQPFSELFFYKFVITKDNFNTLFRYKALNEYLTFFNRYYQKESP